MMNAGEENTIWRRRAEHRQAANEFTGEVFRRSDNENLSLAGSENIFEGDVALGLFGLAIADREELAGPAIGRTVDRISDRLEAIDGDKPSPDQKLHLALARLVIGAHHAGKTVAVGNPDCR